MINKYKKLCFIIAGFLCVFVITLVADAGLLKSFQFNWGNPFVSDKSITKSPLIADLVSEGKALLYARNNIMGARDKFYSAVNADPNDKEAQLYYGITRIFALYEEGQTPGNPTIESIRGLAELAGISFVGTGTNGEILSYGLYNTKGQGSETLPGTTPRTSDVLNFLKNKMLSQVDGAIVNLSNITDITFTSNLNPMAFDPSANNVAVVVDYGDVLVMKAALYGIKATIETLLAYNLDINPPPIFNGDMNDVMRLRTLIANHPNILTPQTQEQVRLENARLALINLVDTFKSGISFIKIRANKANHFFVIDVPLPEETNEVINKTTTDTDKFVNLLDDIKVSLSGPRDFYLSMPDKPVSQRTFDLSKLFNSANPINPRDKIVDARGDIYINDLTFGGVAPYGIKGITEEIPLFPGWNLITLPVIPMDLSVASVLSPITGKYLIVWGHDQDNGWLQYRPGAANTLTYFEANKGYWIYATQFCMLEISGAHPPRSSALKKGWNLVGIPGFATNEPAEITKRNVAISLSSLAGVKYVWGYNSGKWFVHAPTLNTPNIPSLNLFWNNLAYWIKIDNDAELVPPQLAPGTIDGYEVWGGNNDGGDPYSMKSVIMKNPQAFGYTLLGVVSLTDANYSAKTFYLADQYKYVVIKPVNPVAEPVKIDTVGINGQCIWNAGAFGVIPVGKVQNGMYMWPWPWTWPAPATCPDGKYLEIRGNSGLFTMRTYGTTPWNQITIYGVK